MSDPDEAIVQERDLLMRARANAMSITATISQ
jgi:hypothetical protein